MDMSSRSIVIRVHSSCLLHVFLVNVCIHDYRIIQRSIFNVLKYLSGDPFSPPASSLWQPQMFSFAQNFMWLESQFIAFQFGFSLTNMYLNFSVPFHGFRVCFFPTLNTIPLSRYAICHSLTRNIMVASKSVQLWIKLQTLPLCGSAPHLKTRLRDFCIQSKYVNFIRIQQSDLNSVWTLLYSHQQWIEIPGFSHPCQHLMLSALWSLVILIFVLF
jgi:hypothetical protein